MASDAGVKNIEQLAQFGKNIKNLGQNMYQTMQAAQQRMNAPKDGKISRMISFASSSIAVCRISRRCRRCLRSTPTTLLR